MSMAIDQMKIVLQCRGMTLLTWRLRSKILKRPLSRALPQSTEVRLKSICTSQAWRSHLMRDLKKFKVLMMVFLEAFQRVWSLSRRLALSEGTHQFSKISVDYELGKAHDPGEASNDMKNNAAAALWRRYELHTTRLSQELAEQLRLVLEPTLASKLQGDYKTGKRINMKNVIPYITSHYQKDKIWLRRTRPDKRDYRVVIAMDDSRSLSESFCGGAAIEALVMVCDVCLTWLSQALVRRGTLGYCMILISHLLERLGSR